MLICLLMICWIVVGLLSWKTNMDFHVFWTVDCTDYIDFHWFKFDKLQNEQIKLIFLPQMPQISADFLDAQAHQLHRLADAWSVWWKSYPNKSECVPVLVKSKIKFSSSCFHIKSQSGFRWHSQQPLYFPVSLCCWKLSGNLPFSANNLMDFLAKSIS